MITPVNLGTCSRCKCTLQFSSLHFGDGICQPENEYVLHPVGCNEDGTRKDGSLRIIFHGRLAAFGWCGRLCDQCFHAATRFLNGEYP